MKNDSCDLQKDPLAGKMPGPDDRRELFVVCSIE